MSAENKAIVLRFWEEGINRGDFSVIDELVAPYYIERNPVPGLPVGREGVKQALTVIREAFGDFRADVDELFGEDDKVAVRSTFRGTHAGDLFGIPATGRSVALASMHIYRVAGGRLVEHWSISDRQAFIEQLGISALPEALRQTTS